MSDERLSRRTLLSATTALFGLVGTADARTVTGLPYLGNEVYPPTQARPGPWLFFTADEAAAVEAIVDRLIPPDDLSPGGKDSGCAIFIDRQLAGPYGRNEGMYMQGPWSTSPLPTQGYQNQLNFAEQYRRGLAGLAAHVARNFGNRKVQQLSAEELDRLITSMEKREANTPEFNGSNFFELIYNNTMEGFFADPIYGGNKDMVGWRLIGFPGTRYDYRDVIAQPNRRYTLPPVSLIGRPEWDRPAASQGARG
ncbi:gluconate 2-dehydrogenase subunit 3 family protein [Pararoseomonas indoligenes]|uniref:Gluconate 2-dehydrogenase subunit 3 family protein n=1 Tax=Roseomonas indoligenes TaxID=2820811 RepID=A0A940MY53_9PROT|nr:gluconate 2-dehydrogenase subunit 3 family protein [Pararoseomonas indoligenes]MBP0491885.1 gluconate 2-dehydrogenase subunit 3 family protein [Pararoseomonas indoligenes]